MIDMFKVINVCYLMYFKSFGICYKIYNLTQVIFSPRELAWREVKNNIEL